MRYFDGLMRPWLNTIVGHSLEGLHPFGMIINASVLYPSDSQHTTHWSEGVEKLAEEVKCGREGRFSELQKGCSVDAKRWLEPVLGPFADSLSGLGPRWPTCPLFFSILSLNLVVLV